MYSELIESANDLLLYRRFQECIEFCEQQLKILKSSPESPGLLLVKEGLCVVCCQAYAEVNQWQEVLPFITQLYNGIEECPPKVVQLCVLLHARMNDQATCSAIANIWLRNSSNFPQDDYQDVVEIYLTHVLVMAEKWIDIPIFVDSCAGLDQQQKEGLLKQVRYIQNKGDQQKLEAIEEVKVNPLREEEKVSDNMAKKLSDFVSESPFHTFVNQICTWIKKNLPLSAIYMVRNVALLGVILYYFFIKMNFDLLSWQQWASIWAAVVRLWKSMFAPYHLAKQ